MGIAEKMYRKPQSSQGDTLPVLVDNDTYLRFREVSDSMVEQFRGNGTSIYVKGGLRMFQEAIKDMRELPEQVLQHYFTLFGSSMLYIATGERPEDIPLISELEPVEVPHSVPVEMWNDVAPPPDSSRFDGFGNS